VAAQEGKLVFMTTNHIEKLDQALIRPGRVDLVCHFGLATKYQIIKVFKRFYSDATGNGKFL
jgi:chaperone BCS1